MTTSLQPDLSLMIVHAPLPSRKNNIHSLRNQENNLAGAACIPLWHLPLAHRFGTWHVGQDTFNQDPPA